MAAQEEDRPVSAAAEFSGLVVNDELGYPVTVGDHLGSHIRRLLARHRGPLVVLCDSNPYVRRFAATVVPRGVPIDGVALGEAHKRLTTLGTVLDIMAARGADRTTLVLGIGGGVAADLFGFAAATYMRGVAYAHVATSLVAMADAAIGGKTGVNLRAGKNLAGAWHDPVAVFCDVDALRTLPFRCLREGLAEVLKCAIIGGGELFDALETLAPHPFARWPWAAVVAAAVKVKTSVVAGDRREAGAREVLNLGHTFAHAIERASNYRVTHGAAVALGLRASGLLALQSGRLGEDQHLRVLALLALLEMPLRTAVDPHAIFEAMRADKKRRGGRLRFVLPRSIGDVEYGVACSAAAVRAVLTRLARLPEAVRR